MSHGSYAPASRSLIDTFNGSSSAYIRLGAYDELVLTTTQKECSIN